ncbi:MAG: DsbA family protein [Parasphingorhabdus sp.]
MLTIYIDFKSAASYLAFEPTLALIEKTGVEALWHPFSSRPFRIPVEQPDETVGDRHRRVRAIAQRDAHLHYAEVQNLEMQFADKPRGSDAALAALAVIKGDPVFFIRAVFKAYWADHADLEDQAVVAQILDDCGCEQPDWPDAFGKLATIREQGDELKVFETPTYLIDNQIFLGREHLPWIKSIIVAN